MLDLFKKKPEPAAADKVYRELQDGPVRDLLRLVLHHGVRASKPDPPASQTPSAEVGSLQEELRKLKHEARSVSVLSISLLSEVQASRRKLMWSPVPRLMSSEVSLFGAPKMLRLCIAS